MTDFIHGEALLEEAEINRIIESAPSDLVAFQERAAQQPVDHVFTALRHSVICNP